MESAGASVGGHGGAVTILRCLLIGWMAAVSPSGGASPVMERVAAFELPGVEGRVDHLAADPAAHRIFIAALGNDTVEVLDTQDGRRRTLSGLGKPQGVLYLASVDRLVIANGEGNSVDLVDASSLLPRKRIVGMDDADNLRYDAGTGKVWVGYGKGGLRMLDPVDGEAAGEVVLPGHPESFQLERQGKRAFVNVPSARSVVVVDLARREVLEQWQTPQASSNFPMAIDEEGGRLFVGARSPPTLLVYDTRSGKVVSRVPIGRDADDVFFDAESKRLYVICGEGKVDVIRQVTPDQYAIDASIDTAPHARTGLFVPEERRLYVAAPASGTSPARILVYRVR